MGWGAIVFGRRLRLQDISDQVSSGPLKRSVDPTTWIKQGYLRWSWSTPQERFISNDWASASWTDSTILIYYLHEVKSPLYIFLSQGAVELGHVKSTDNAADICLCEARNLHPRGTRTNGPEFLTAYEPLVLERP